MEGKRPICSFKQMGGVPFTQHMYRCNTCHFSETETICEGCVKFCHQSHELVDMGYIYGICHCGNGCYHCHCFLMHPVNGDEDIPPNKSRQCTYCSTGPHFRLTSYYSCSDCNIARSNNKIACEACAKLCHKSHHGVVDEFISLSGYCDCGDPTQHYQCKIQPPIDYPNPPPICTYNISKDTPIPQFSYICKTCGIEEDRAFCQACAKVCHKGHDIQQVFLPESICHCGQNPLQCKLMQSQNPAL